MKHDNYRDEEISCYFICNFSTLIWEWAVLVMPPHQFNIENDFPLILCSFCHLFASLTQKLINLNWYDYFLCLHIMSSISNILAVRHWCFPFSLVIILRFLTPPPSIFIDLNFALFSFILLLFFNNEQHIYCTPRINRVSIKRITITNSILQAIHLISLNIKLYYIKLYYLKYCTISSLNWPGAIFWQITFCISWLF